MQSILKIEHYCGEVVGPEPGYLCGEPATLMINVPDARVLPRCDKHAATTRYGLRPAPDRWVVEEVDGPEWASNSCAHCGGSPGSHEIEGYDDVCERFYGRKVPVLQAHLYEGERLLESFTASDPAALSRVVAKSKRVSNILTALQLGALFNSRWGAA